MKQAKNKDKGANIIKVDKNLDKYLEKGLFKEKLDKANHVLKTVGLPKFSDSTETKAAKRKMANKVRH